MPRFPVETSKGTIEVLSQGEASMMKILDRAPGMLPQIIGYPIDVLSWEYEPTRIELTPEFEYDGKVYKSSSYTPDFVIMTAQGFVLYVEIKGWNTFRREEEQLKEKDFIYRWILPNQATARYVKLVLTAKGLTRETWDKERRTENIVNKSKAIRHNWTQIGYMLKGKKHEKIDIDEILKSTAYYRKNYRVATKKDFMREHQKDIKILATSDNPSSEACFEHIKARYLQMEKDLKGDHYKPLKSGQVKYEA